uniref:shikimate dehydrogenase (NADP(+)) n=1 Tax=Desulfomonile tiedjei TaxID=2358 RepID=A0A7C4EU37_9BACT
MTKYGLIGDARAENSLSPIIFETVFKRLGYHGQYVVLRAHPKDLPDVAHSLKLGEFDGINVTIPHKEAVIPYLDDLSQRAGEVGAVNTIVFDRGRAVGFNTDIGGFDDLLDRYGMSSIPSDVCIFGAGGATRAVLYSVVRRCQGSINVINRTYSKSCELTSRLGGRAIPLENAAQALESCTLLINTTSVSEIDEARRFLPIFSDQIRMKKLHTIIDINYGRKTNFWRELAAANDAQFVDGLFMLAAQARRSFFLWTGRTIDMKLFLQPLGIDP